MTVFTKYLGKFLGGLSLLVYPVQFVAAQCGVGPESGASLVSAVNCNDGNFRLGSGAYFDLPVASNTYYVFSWNSNGAPNMHASQFCADPQNGSGSAFTGNQTAWFSGSTTLLRVSSFRTNASWVATSGLMTYRHTTPAAATSNANASPICVGTSVTITGGGGTNGTLYYQGTTSNGTNTTTTINPQTFVPPAGNFTYYWRAGNNGCWGAQGSATVAVSAATVGGSASSTAPTACIGSTVGINLSGQLGTVNNWEGRFNGGAWGNIGFNGSTSFTSPVLNQVGVYEFRAAVVNSPCNGAFSNPASVTVVAATVAGNAAPAVNNFCVGGNTTISLSGNTGNVTSWERRVNGGAWASIGNAGLTTISTGTLNVAGTYEYRANVQNAPCGALQSTIAVVVVDAASVGGNANSTGTLICNGDNPTISLTGHTGAVLFWERQINGGGFNNIGNAGLTSFSTGALVPAVYVYRAVVQNGTCPQATSSSITVTVSDFSVGGSAVPQVTALCQGSSTNVTLSGHTGNILNWEHQVNGGGWNNIGNVGLTVINTGALPAGNNEFRAVIKNGGCPEVQSTPALIAVDPTSVGGTLIANFNTVCAGATVDLILSGQTGNIINWERQYNGGGWTNIGNNGSNLLTTSPLTPDGIYEFRVVVQSGICAQTTSNAVAITVNPYDNAAFSYSSSVFCQGGNNPSPSIAQGGGSFIATPAGLDIDASTGIINVSGSTPGAYTITHTTSGACPATANQAVTIVGSGNAGFSYSNLNYCLNGVTNPSPTVITNGGTFTSQPAGLIFANANTGEVNLALSMPGSYYVTYTLPGVCPSSQTQTVNLLPAGNSTFAYSSSTHCLSGGTNPSPSISVFGGTFSSAPGGLVFTNNQTGTIDLSASSAGTYAVTYNSGGPCATTSSQNITLNNTGNAQFSYSSNSFCKNAANPAPTVNTGGGVFSSSPGGLSFVNTSTGVINLAATQPGTYSITYTLAGSCASSFTQAVTVFAAGNSTFAYASSSYCLGGTNNPSPTIAAFGGTFSASPFGMVFSNNQTGTIDLMTSTPGTYTVTYNSGGACPTTSTQTITLEATGDPLFFYFASSFCKNAANPVPFVSQAGGSFTSSPAGLLFVSPATGEISLATSQPGGYVVTYNTGGQCPSQYSQNVLIIANENATFNYSQGAYCQNDVNPTPTVAQIGGTFTAPAGLVFENQFTGKINLAASAAGTYMVTYTVPGACAGVYSQQVIINAGATATLSYPASSFCTNTTNPAAIASPAGGTFNATPLGLSIGSTGTIDLSASVPGAYTVSYTAPGACGTTASTNVLVINSPQAFIQPINTLCTGSSATIMSASPAGGTWSGGPYITSNGVFDPAVSGAGSFPVNYIVSGSGGCAASATYNVVVNSSPTVNITPAGPFCSNDSIQVLTASPLGGMWSGNPFVSINGLFFPAEAGPGVYPVMYTINNGGCTSSAIASIQVLNSPTPVINPVASICASGAPIGLTSNISGGTWAGGPYVSPSGTFNPALASVGNNLVTYTVNTGICTAQSSANIAVNGNPNVNIITPSPFCQNDNPSFLIANIPGGVFVGGAYVNGAGLFNPALASLGNNVVIYTMTSSNGCVGSDTVNVLVNNNPNATITDPGIVCEDAPPFNLVGATAGGTFGGGAYVNNGVFNPAVAGPGAHTVTYNVSTGGCSSNSSITVTVDPNPLALFNYLPNALLVYFTDLSSNVNSWLWNFGDGSPEVTTQNPIHIFPDNGIYQVRLIATNDCGSDTLIRGVLVNKNVSVSENNVGGSLQIFPNPTDAFVNLAAMQLEAGEWMLNVSDISGKTVMSETVYTADGTINKKIDVAAFRPGVYFLNLQHKGTLHTVKFVKM